MSSPEPIIKRLPPPFIYLPTLANFRDVGGLPITPAHESFQKAAGEEVKMMVRRRILYRSADPSLVTSEEIKFLRCELGITRIYDLRSEPEFVKQGDDVLEEWEGRIEEFNRSSEKKITRHWTPVFKTQDYSPEKIALRFRAYGSENTAQGFAQAYSQILQDGAPSYSKILQHLASPPPSTNEDTGILIHCTAGKDRTGVLIALILSILGVSVDEICREYQLTELGLEHRKAVFVERIAESGAFEGDAALAAALRMTGANAESMKATLEMIEEKYGGPEMYVRNVCGLGDREIEGLRRNLIVRRDGVGGEEEDKLAKLHAG